MTDLAVEHVDSDAHDDHDHPTDAFYVKIALILAFFTLIEVGTYFESVHNAPEWAMYVVLSVLMIIKFVMVGAYFMHLKYDTVWFRRVFIAGVVLACIVYVIMFLAYNRFGFV